MRSAISFCVCRLSPSAEIIGKAVWRKRYSNLAVSTSTSTGAMFVTSRMTISFSIPVSVTRSPSIMELFMAQKVSSSSWMLAD